VIPQASRMPLFAAATSLAVLGLYLHTRLSDPATTDQPAAPDMYIDHPVWQQFDVQGRLSRQLRAERMEHWPGEDASRLVEPRLRLGRDSEARWTASARRGQLQDQPALLVLEQQVVLAREPATAGPVINTSWLRISGPDHLIETDRAVVLNSGSWHVTATGLHAAAGSRRLELLENVRGIHD
jgi:lipopolysaccharide export system protein LptC